VDSETSKHYSASHWITGNTN